MTCGWTRYAPVTAHHLVVSARFLPTGNPGMESDARAETRLMLRFLLSELTQNPIYCSIALSGDWNNIVK